MRDAIVFNGAVNLDFQEIRTNVIRIPEVVQRIREAQAIWDRRAISSLDLGNFIASEDSVFLGNLRLKNFAMAVVQVGLLDRYLKNHRIPEFLIGAVNGDSPLKVAIGQKSFEALVNESAALSGSAARISLTSIQGGDLPVLSGMQLTEFAVYQLVDGSYVRLEAPIQEIEKLILNVVDQYAVQKVIMIGPGQSLNGRRSSELGERDVQILESIDQDPMLSWFWTKLREERLPLAN